MPNLFTVSGYKIYFWSNENNEPIHVHISKGKPSPDSTKVWLTKKEDVFYPITEVRFQKRIKSIDGIYISPVFSYMFRMEEIFCYRRNQILLLKTIILRKEILKSVLLQSLVRKCGI